MKTKIWTVWCHGHSLLNSSSFFTGCPTLSRRFLQNHKCVPVVHNNMKFIIHSYPMKNGFERGHILEKYLNVGLILLFSATLLTLSMWHPTYFPTKFFSRDTNEGHQSPLYLTKSQKDFSLGIQNIEKIYPYPSMYVSFGMVYDSCICFLIEIFLWFEF